MGNTLLSPLTGAILRVYYVNPLQVGLEVLGSTEDQVLRLAC